MGVIEAALAGAFVASNLASIAGTQFGGGGSVSSVSSAGSVPSLASTVGTPVAVQSMPAPAASAAAQTPAPPRIVNIVVDSNAYGNLAQFVRTSLIPALNTAAADGYTINGVAA